MPHADGAAFCLACDAGERNPHPFIIGPMASSLTALSPLDGRYAGAADPLRPYFSEHALIRYRVRIELAWLQALAAESQIKELKPFSKGTSRALAQLVSGFSE